MEGNKDGGEQRWRGTKMEGTKMVGAKMEGNKDGGNKDMGRLHCGDANAHPYNYHALKVNICPSINKKLNKFPSFRSILPLASFVQ